MNNIFSFQIPARPDLSDKVISVIETWVNTSSFYSFDDLSLKDAHSYTTYACREATLAYIRITDTDHAYIGVRLSRPDVSNVEWSADLTYECGPDGNYFYIQLSRGIVKCNDFANMRILPQMPDIVRLIAEQDMLLDDAGFQIADKPIALSPAVLQICKDAFAKKSMVILPIIFANCSGNPEIIEIMESVAKDFAGMVHIITASTEEEKLRWKELDWLDLNFLGATVCFPRVGIIKKIAFQEEFKDILMYMTAYISQQNLPTNTMTWEKLMSLPRQDTEMIGIASGEYHLMNKQMSDSIKMARKKLGFSQIELAARAGTTGLIISRLETLRISRVKKHLMKQIECALNLSPGTISSLEYKKNGGSFDAPIEQTDITPEIRNGCGQGHSVQNVFCRKCGIKLFSDSLFCHQCGSKLPEGHP